MAIEGLKNTYNIPLIKNERETNSNQKKKKNREPKKEKDRENDTKKNSEGKVDIRI